MHGCRVKVVLLRQIMSQHPREEEWWFKLGRHFRLQNQEPRLRPGNLSLQRNRLFGLLHQQIPLDYMPLKLWIASQSEARQVRTGLPKVSHHARVLNMDTIITATTTKPFTYSALILSSEPRATVLH